MTVFHVAQQNIYVTVKKIIQFYSIKMLICISKLNQKVLPLQTLFMEY